MKRKWNKKRTFLVCSVLLALALLVLIVCDSRLKTVYYAVESNKLSAPIRFILLTDLHSCRYGENQKNLLETVQKFNPDIILLGGDIFDDKVPYKNAELTVKQLSEKYPCYYVTGNHEYWSRDIGTILDIVKGYGITVLSGECDTIEIKGQTISICGVDDPDAEVYLAEGVPIDQQLNSASEAAKEAEKTVGEELFTVLLSHRPELYETYQEYDFDLVLSGHAHGGQWRIPGILNGLFAPNQGLFPEYAGGRYDYKNGTMIVSRGLARESTPIPRIFNRPELVIVDIFGDKASEPTQTVTSMPTSEPTQLTDEEIRWFNEEFFNTDGDVRRNDFLNCTYTDVKCISIYDIFYNLSEEISTEEKKALRGSEIDFETDFFKLTASYMDGVLREHMNISFEEVDKVDLDYYLYLEEFDAYFDCHGDTNYSYIEVKSGEKDESGTVKLQYLRREDDKEYIVTLKAHKNGYYFVSNSEVE